VLYAYPSGNLSLAYLWRVALNGPVDYWLRLFKEAHTPDDGDELSSFVECDFPGYDRMRLKDWKVPYSGDSGAFLLHEIVTFGLVSGTQTVFGYLITDANNNLLFAEVDPSAPVTLSLANPAYPLQPRLRLRRDTEG
jgi:hypothetical protein